MTWACCGREIREEDPIKIVCDEQGCELMFHYACYQAWRNQACKLYGRKDGKTL